MEGFQYETELIDHMSGPAHSASDSLEHLATSAHKAHGVFEEFAHSMVGHIAAGELLAEGLKHIAEGAVEVAEKFGELVVEGVHFALEMSEFKEHAIDAYSIIKGTAEEGEAAYDEIDKLAKAVHMPVMEAQKVATQLMEQGLENTEEVKNVIQSVSDLQRTGHERGAEKLQQIISNSLATGFLQLPKKGLGALGTPGLLEDLAAQFHMPVKEFQKSMKDMKIGAEDGIKALESVLLGSKVHEIAAKKFTLQDLANDAKNFVTSLFTDIDAAPLMNALHDIEYAFTGDAEKGGNLKTIVTDTFDTIIQFISPVIEAITVLGLEFEIGYLKAKIAAQPLIDDLGTLTGYAPDLDELGYAAEGIAYAMTQAAIGALWLVAKLGELVSGDSRHALVEGFKELGSDMVDGLVSSLTGGVSKVALAMAHLVSAGLSAADDSAERHSPSRKTFDLGEDIYKGLVMGVDSGADEVGRAMGDMVSMPSPQNDNARGWGRSVTVESGAITAHVHVGGTTASADEIREGVMAALEDVTEQLVLEMGG